MIEDLNPDAAPAPETVDNTVTPATAAGLKDADYNPREWDKPGFDSLVMSLATFGDLGCVVRNVITGNLVGGHRRKDAMIADGDAPIEITHRYESPTTTGTIAEGFLLYNGERFKYREVAWDLDFEQAANIAANEIQARFDDDKRAEVLAQMSEKARALTGLTQDKIKALLQRSSAPENPAANDPKGQTERQSYKLTFEQAEVVVNAIAKCKTLYNLTLEPNDDLDGNALFFIAREWLDAKNMPQPAVGETPQPSEFNDAAAV